MIQFFKTSFKVTEEVPVEEANATEEVVNGEVAEVEGPTVEGQPGEGDDAGFCDLDRETVRNAFHLFDTDNNGVISSEELGNLLRTLGQDPTESHINELIEILDANKNGTIEEEEFLRIIEERAGLPDDIEAQEESYRSAFRVFDRDESGKISADELRNVVKGYGRMRLTSMEAEEMLKTADIDTDGLISYEEFVKLFCGKA